MKAFAAKLREHVGKTEGTRPLLCDGNPLTCTVALVGANPVRSLGSGRSGATRAGWIGPPGSRRTSMSTAASSTAHVPRSTVRRRQR